jgi:hypothetical protein
MSYPNPAKFADIIVPTLGARLDTSVLLSPLPVIPAGIAGIQGQGR